MAKRRRIVAQPPIDRWHRPSEWRLMWTGLGIAIVAGLLLWRGLIRQHPLLEPDGKAATQPMAEPELVRSVVYDRVQRVADPAHGRIAIQRVGTVDKNDNTADPCPT